MYVCCIVKPQELGKLEVLQIMLCNKKKKKATGYLVWFHKNNQCLYDFIQPHPALSHPNLRPSCSALEKVEEGSQVMGYNDLAKMVDVLNYGRTE